MRCVPAQGPSSEALHLGHLIPFMFTKYLQVRTGPPCILLAQQELSSSPLSECLDVQGAVDPSYFTRRWSSKVHDASQAFAKSFGSGCAVLRRLMDAAACTALPALPPLHFLTHLPPLAACTPRTPSTCPLSSNSRTTKRRFGRG